VAGGDVVESSGRYTVHILLDQPQRTLRWGMTMEVTFTTQNKEHHSAWDIAMIDWKNGGNMAQRLLESGHPRGWVDQSAELTRKLAAEIGFSVLEVLSRSTVS